MLFVNYSWIGQWIGISKGKTKSLDDDYNDDNAQLILYL